ncbi:MAG: restriction endonuclease subunit S [Evtepia gabavorous]
MKKSILQYAIQGKLVEQRTEEGTGEELYQQIQVYKKNLIKDGRLKKTRALEPISEAAIPFDFPQPWKVCYIDDIAFVTKLAGFEYTKYIADNLVADGIPLFKGKNVQNGKLVLSFESYIPKSISDELPRSQIAKKCLLTPYVGTIGNIAIFDGSFKAHLGSNVGKIELLNSDIQTFVLEEYVLWYLKSTYGYAELTKHKKATAQESISIDAIRNVIIAIPPLEEQYRIVAKIEELLPLCDRLRK